MYAVTAYAAEETPVNPAPMTAIFPKGFSDGWRSFFGGF